MYNFNETNQNRNIFSNPFSLNNNIPSSSSLNDAYKQLEFLKAQHESLQHHANENSKNVFSDIVDEWGKASEDEKIFIQNSQEYQSANAQYEQEFNAFLIEYLGNDFLKSPHGKAAENVLAVIRNRKDNYKNKFANDISEIREKNSKLEQNNEELAKSNLILQEQLKEIQARLSGGLDER
jgi:hypothetical protein